MSNNLDSLIKAVKEKVNFLPDVNLEKLFLDNKFDEFEKRLAEGADPDEKYVHEKNSLSLISTTVASRDVEKNIKYASLLIGYSVNVNARNNFGESPFRRALYFGNDTRILDLLLAAGAKEEEANKINTTYLHVACRNINKPSTMIKYLFNKNIIHKNNINDFNQPDNYGVYPVHSLAENASTEAFNFLIEKGINLNVVDRQGNTPLHRAIAKKNTFCIELLKKNTVRLDLPNAEGKTAEQLLKAKNLSNSINEDKNSDEMALKTRKRKRPSTPFQQEKKKSEEDSQTEDEDEVEVLEEGEIPNKYSEEEFESAKESSKFNQRSFEGTIKQYENLLNFQKQLNQGLDEQVTKLQTLLSKKDQELKSYESKLESMEVDKRNLIHDLSQEKQKNIILTNEKERSLDERNQYQEKYVAQLTANQKNLASEVSRENLNLKQANQELRIKVQNLERQFTEYKQGVTKDVLSKLGV